MFALRRFVLCSLLGLALLVFQQGGLVHAYDHGHLAGEAQRWLDGDHGADGVCDLCLALAGMGNGLAGRAGPAARVGPFCFAPVAHPVARVPASPRAYAARAPPLA